MVCSSGTEPRMREYSSGLGPGEGDSVSTSWGECESSNSDPRGQGHSNSSLAPVMLDRISSSGTRGRTQNCSGVAWDLDLGQHLDLGLGGRAQSSSSNSTAPALENQWEESQRVVQQHSRVMAG